MTILYLLAIPLWILMGFFGLIVLLAILRSFLLILWKGPKWSINWLGRHLSQTIRPKVKLNLRIELKSAGESIVKAVRDFGHGYADFYSLFTFTTLEALRRLVKRRKHRILYVAAAFCYPFLTIFLSVMVLALICVVTGIAEKRVILASELVWVFSVLFSAGYLIYLGYELVAWLAGRTKQPPYRPAWISNRKKYLRKFS